MNIIKRNGSEVDFDINIKGVLKEFDLTKITDELKYGAKIKFMNVGAKSFNNGMTTSEMNGDILLDENNFNINLNGLLNGSEFKINGNSDFKNINLNTNFSNLNFHNFINVCIIFLSFIHTNVCKERK